MYRQDNVSYISILKCILDLEKTKRSVGGLLHLARVSAKSKLNVKNSIFSIQFEKLINEY